MDVSADKTVFDNRETVLYTSRRAAGNVVYNVANVLPLTEQRSEYAPSSGAAIAATRRFEFPAALTFTPKPGDFFVAAGVTWYVNDASPPEFLATWIVLAYRTFVEPELDVPCTYHRRIYNGVNAFGDSHALDTYTTTSFLAAIIPLDNPALVVLGGEKRYARGWTFITATDFSPQYGDLVTIDSAPTAYGKVIAVEGRMRYTNLVQLIAVEV